MRLTEYQATEGGIPYVVVKDEQDALQKLAAYEDAEEQGRLVILPCKVGDTVYYIDGGWCHKAKAQTFRFNNSGVRVYCERNFMGCIGFEGIYGKTVFLTRAEAEAALKGEKKVEQLEARPTIIPAEEGE